MGSEESVLLTPQLGLAVEFDVRMGSEEGFLQTPGFGAKLGSDERFHL